jgi:hypothetical protein
MAQNFIIPPEGRADYCNELILNILLKILGAQSVQSAGNAVSEQLQADEI